MRRRAESPEERVATMESRKMNRSGRMAATECCRTRSTDTREPKAGGHLRDDARRSIERCDQYRSRSGATSIEPMSSFRERFSGSRSTMRIAASRGRISQRAYRCVVSEPTGIGSFASSTCRLDSRPFDQCPMDRRLSSPRSFRASSRARHSLANADAASLHAVVGDLRAQFGRSRGRLGREALRTDRDGPGNTDAAALGARR